MRLQLIVALPTVALLALAASQTHGAGQRAGEAQRARVFAATATATGALMHLLERELAETQALRARGDAASMALVTAARERTDTAAERYRLAATAASAAAPDLVDVFREANAALDDLDVTRPREPAETDDPDHADQRYRAILGDLLAVADALPTQLADARLAGPARAIAALAGLEHAAAQQRDLLRGAFGRGRLTAAEVTALAGLIATETERLSSFHRAGDARASRLFRQRVQGPDVQTARDLRERAMAAAGEISVDADVWYVAQSHTIRHLREVAVSTAERLDATAAEIQSRARWQVVITVLTIVGFAAGTLTIAIFMASRTSGRLRQLRDRALAVATRELPATIESIGKADDPVSVRDRDLRTAHSGDVTLAGGRSDEITELARAFAAVHRQALYLATEQALRRRDIAVVFEALARRSQTLVGRQLRLIDTLEAEETDPDVLDWLYRLDHLAARMRRNDENLLVLAGGRPARRFSTAVELYDVVRAAAAEIEDYQRVEPVDLPDLAVTSGAVGDVMHLLAELLENATAFSPPATRVTVTGRCHVDGLQLAIHDHGIGMSADAIAAANHALAQPRAMDAAMAGTMGLLVVARLAERHGISVTLHRGKDGVSALVDLPQTLLAPAVAPLKMSAEDGQLRRPLHERIARQDPPVRVWPAHEHAPSPDPIRIRARLAGLNSAMAAARRGLNGDTQPTDGQWDAQPIDGQWPDVARPDRGSTAMMFRPVGDPGGHTAEISHLDWLLTRFVEQVPQVCHALAISADGLAMAASEHLPEEHADQLAAIACGLSSLSLGTAFFTSGGAVRQSIVDMARGVLLVLTVGDRALLAVLAATECDIGHVGYETSMLAQRVGEALGPAAREPERLRT